MCADEVIEWPRRAARAFHFRPPSTISCISRRVPVRSRFCSALRGQHRVKGCLRDYAGIMTGVPQIAADLLRRGSRQSRAGAYETRSEEHTSELQSLTNLVCRLL